MKDGQSGGFKGREHLWLPPTQTGRGATYVVAASDALGHVKRQADEVCPGTSDNVTIQAFVDIGGLVRLTGGTFTVGPLANILLQPNTALIGNGIESTAIVIPNNTSIGTLSSTKIPFLIGADPADSVEYVRLADFTIDGGTQTQNQTAIELSDTNYVWISKIFTKNISEDCFSMSGTHGAAPTFVRVNDCLATNWGTVEVKASAFECDDGATDIVVASCTAWSGEGQGFDAHSHEGKPSVSKIRFIDCHAHTIGQVPFSVLTSSGGTNITKNVYLIRPIADGGDAQGNAIEAYGVDGLIIVDPYIDGGKIRIHNGDGSYPVTKLLIRGGWIYNAECDYETEGANSSAIWMEYVTDFEITGVKIYTSIMGDIAVENCTRGKIHDNHGSGNGSGGSGLRATIVADTCSELDIYSNTGDDNHRGIIVGSDDGTSRVHHNRLTNITIAGTGTWYIPAGQAYDNIGYIAPGEIRTYEYSIDTLTENAYNSLDNPFGQSVVLMEESIYISTGATPAATLDCGVGSSATADYATVFNGHDAQTTGVFSSLSNGLGGTVTGVQTDPIIWESGSGNRYLNHSIKDAAATDMVAKVLIKVKGL